MGSVNYSRGAVLDWLHRTCGVNNRPNADEVQTVCPMCNSSKLYFNIRKQVGICHSASCEWHEKVTLENLIEVFGFTPDQGGEWEPDKERGIKTPSILPGWPILKFLMNKLMTTNQQALDYLRNREIDDLITLNWGLTCDGERIYVPIYDVDGNLVNYNSRILPGYDGPKYLYYPGAKTSYYILGWKECRDWEELTLVENTFVSLAYRNKLQCSTTFGSNISDIQADAIAESGIKRVYILWDENAEDGAHRAWTKLSDRGVKSVYWKILGQPDDYPISWVTEKKFQLHEALNRGLPWLDLTNECLNIRQKGIIY